MIHLMRNNIMVRYLHVHVCMCTCVLVAKLTMHEYSSVIYTTPYDYYPIIKIQWEPVPTCS